ncbi:hypothetical protein H4R20_002144 [Coemansia guatemalensis]|uniref:RNI-like protein n=1 Tax=Coemansia guatemalensis TaxID=2761395 RepID=A0A9W8HW36_9FUNG|nr:hypothetical protein H4R20_002144 [Coemansia guatemalensis]
MIDDGSDLVNYDNLSRVLECSHNLMSLYMGSCPGIRAPDFQEMFNRSPYMCRSLTSFNVSGSEILRYPMQFVLKAMPNLEVLNLSHTFTDDELLDTIAECNRNIERLYLSKCFYITELGIREVVDKCLKLEYLDVTDCPYCTELDFVESRGIHLEWGSRCIDYEEYIKHVETYGDGMAELYHSDNYGYEDKYSYSEEYESSDDEDSDVI